MTTVTKDSFGGGGMGRGARKGGDAGGGGGWRRLWQIPLLIVGVFVFGLGIKALVKAIRPVPFEQQVKGVHATLEKGEFAKAIEQINMLGDYYKEKGQAAQLQSLAGDTFYYASVKQGGTVKGNWEKVEDHYRKAVALGAAPTALMDVRWGEAALAARGDARLAIEKLEAAGAAGGDPALLAVHGHDLVAAYLSLNQYEKADAVVDRVLALKNSGVDERVWGLCKKIELAMKQEGGMGAALDRALQAASEAVKGIPEQDPAGRVYLWIGRAEYEQGHIAAAKEHLELARSKFLVHNLDDGRSAVLLGKIAQAQGDVDAAGKYYQEVVTSHAGTTVWAAARLGRAEISAIKGDAGTQMEEDYRYVIKALKDGGPVGIGEGKGPPELVTLDQVRASLVAEFDRYSAANRLGDAMTFLVLQEDLKDPETAATALRLATTREKRAAQLMQEAAAEENAKPETQNAKRDEAMGLLRQAAQDYVRHAKLTTMDDTVSAESYWKAAQLFDAGGETTRSIDVYEKLTMDRLRDPRVAEALLAIGRLYQSAGKLDEAITYYQRDIEWNPKTPTAYTSRVNLAWCYMTQGPDHFPQAEASLLKLVQENADIEPTANEFRSSLFALGELYFRWGKWREAILRLEEAVGRYPEDACIPRASFMLAESYRHSAMDIGAALQKGGLSGQREALEKARVERLMHAADLLGGVIGMLDAESDQQNRKRLAGNRKWALGQRGIPGCRKKCCGRATWIGRIAIFPRGILAWRSGCMTWRRRDSPWM